jgi:hypothetical protein
MRDPDWAALQAQARRFSCVEAGFYSISFFLNFTGWGILIGLRYKLKPGASPASKLAFNKFFLKLYRMRDPDLGCVTSSSPALLLRRSLAFIQ